MNERSTCLAESRAGTVVMRNCTTTVEDHPSKVRWSNHLSRAPMMHSLIEQRLIYYLTILVNRKYKELNLGKASSWQDLTFVLTERDLALIGGNTHVVQTYSALTKIAGKVIQVRKIDSQGQNLYGGIHWIDAFWYDPANKTYEVKLSKELMLYLVELTENYTLFSPYVAMTFKTRPGQKMYELCSCYAMNFQYNDVFGRKLKKNVLYIGLHGLRYIFNLLPVVDSRTQVETKKAKYERFNDIKERFLKPAQKELFDSFSAGGSEIWFDFCPLLQGKKTIGVYFFFYKKDYPKKGVMRPWCKGDEALNPYQTDVDDEGKQASVDLSCFENLGVAQLEYILENALSKYFEKEEVWYYINSIKRYDVESNQKFLQVLQLIKTKEQQQKFNDKNTTKTFQCNCLREYVLNMDLNKKYGWCIPPMTSLSWGKKKAPPTLCERMEPFP